MSSVLFVPIHLDALLLSNDQTFVGPMADFTLLPYFDGQRDVNPDVAYVSEDIVSRPFEDQTLYLKAGVHLHWALPDALTRGAARAGGTEFPAVPNRWLVIRSRRDAQGQMVEEKRWVVESDYLYPDGAGDSSGSVSIPYKPAANERRPFRFLGRNMPSAAWRKVDPSAQYFKPLTAVGYGEPSFAAFYPNCHSVFGFHDADYAGVMPDGVRYDVLGWYSASTLDAPAAGGGDDSDEDFLQRFVEDARAKYAEASADEALDAADLVASLEKDAGWTVLLDDVVNWYAEEQREQVRTYLERTKADFQAANRELPSASAFVKMVSDEQQLMLASGSGDEFPSQVLCYASLTFDAAGGARLNPAASDPNTAVAVGNTGTEALSAYLASLIDPDHKPVIEDQLEALLLSSHLEHRQLDVGFKFEEARHEKGFTAVNGGSLWTVTQETPGAPAPASAPDAGPLQGITLPPQVAHQLSALDTLQQQYDRSQQAILAMRRQLFSDWYKYMLSAYPPQDSKDDYPDADEVKHYIETKGIAPLLRAVAAAGELLLQSDEAGAVTDARASGPSGDSLASALASAVKDLLRSLDFDSSPELQDVLKYRVTDQSLASLKAAGLPDSLAQSLANLKGEVPRGKADFLELVSGQIGDAQAAAYGRQILKAAQAAVYRLKLTPGPRFWQPNEPVVLLSGAAAEPTDRHGQDGQLRDDGLLVCRMLPGTDLKDVVPSNFDALTGMLEQIRATAGAVSFAFNEWAENPWNPLLLEWEVEVFPVDTLLNNLHPRSEGYTADFILGNYALREGEVDLSYKAGRGAVTKAANVYSGRSIMSPHAGLKLEHELERFFVGFMEPDLLERFYSEQSIPEADRNRDYLLRHFPQLFTWYRSSSDVLLQFHSEHGSSPDGPATGEAWLRQNMSAYVTWTLERMDVKKRFYDAQKTPDEDRTDAYLSAHADQFVGWLKPQIYNLGHFFSDEKVPAEEQGDAYLQGHLRQLIAWYQAEIESDLQMVVMGAAYMRLSASNYLSQSLGGFNDALLMHRQTMQLPVADPIGFQEYQEFAGRVRDAVGDATTIAPQPLNDFNPVLSGAMRLNSLRLVDTFGQVLDVNCERVTATNLMATRGSEYLLTLPPRLVQPARLNFRWLSASHGDMEMNGHPATTPVCGWVLPNNLDNSLMVYDADGLALGSITASAVGWRTAPGQTPLAPDDIANPHLRKMVKHLVGQGEAFLNDFITTIDSALEDIEPENFAQHQGLALLVGRPLALVRASLQWELQGAPALNQSWEAFRLDLRRTVRETDRFTSVQFPVRVGEYRQLNDGLVGYWKEAGGGYEGGVFYAPQSSAVGSDRIKTHADAQTDGDPPVAVFLSPDSPLQTIAMLVDPRGEVHATSGVVPTKAINIPPDQYVAALHAIQVTFLSAPILTGAGEINLPLPTEPGYRWAWLEKDGAAWSETSALGGVGTGADFAGRQELREGWLKLIEVEQTPTPGAK
jgi:ketosteroid isomerase-like protein